MSKHEGSRANEDGQETRREEQDDGEEVIGKKKFCSEGVKPMDTFHTQQRQAVTMRQEDEEGDKRRGRDGEERWRRYLEKCEVML